MNFTPGQHITLGGVPEGMTALVLKQMMAEAANGLLFVGADDGRLARLADALAYFAPEVEIVNFPAWDCLPYDRVSPQASTVAEQLTLLTQLLDGKPRLVLASVSALSLRFVPREWLQQQSFMLSAKGKVNISALQLYLANSGYTRTDTVREPGEFAVRGGLLDMFPTGSPQPLRLDLFGDTIESLRSFDPLTQRTIGNVESIALLPATPCPLDEAAIAHFRQAYREAFGAVLGDDLLYNSITEGRRYPGMEHWLPLFHAAPLATLLDYLPDRPIVLDNQAEEAMASRIAQVVDFYQARIDQQSIDKKKDVPLYKPLRPEALYVTAAEWETLKGAASVLQLSPFPQPGGVDMGGRMGRTFADVRANPDLNLVEAVVSSIRAEKRRVLLAGYTTGSRERLLHILREHNAPEVEAAVLPLDHGFETPELVVISEADIFGERLARPAKKRRRAENYIAEVSSLNEGDLVIHVDHGLGRYAGLETVQVGGAAHDCLKVVYADGDRLFVPVENIDVLSRYGSDDATTQLDKLGGAAWQGRKARVKKKLRDMAEALLKIAAERAVRQGDEIAPPDGLYQEFAARFPYAETEDQLGAIEDVLADMQSGRPMDRLVCGDVGFGKTEVAIRAAFVVAMSGRQVAIIAPTTLLARQHYRNIIERFKGLPLRVAQLSRLVAGKEAIETKRALAEGQVDVVIGTHSLLGKLIKFANLGLVVVDEEQHFGVKQKERLKELRAEVHVLTLTATPIPRTLQLALAGVREMSLITTPPIDRLAVRTFVTPYDAVILREALMREHFRGGQSFYVTPRLEDIPMLSERLRELVPDIKFAVAHGQMAAGDLENVISDFYAGKFDLLLSTNIVESGLDIPNANTIIIHRSDLFGLAQLYQLRGRVGRGKLRGYAYLTYPAERVLNQTAQKRLEVMTTLDSLGAGFTLASHDMDIRGGGNLLGEEQSGHIREVGAELYQQMLEEAVAEARAAKQGVKLEEGENWQPLINVGIPVLIPEHYVADLGLRLSLYRRVADLADEAAMGDFAVELVDRFGKMPPEVQNLLAVVTLKQLCRKAHVEKCDAGPKGAVLAFRQNKHPNPAAFLAWLAKQGGAIKMRPDQKLVALRAWDDEKQRMKGLNKLLQELATLT